MYGYQVKHTKPLKDFDRRPVEYQGTTPQQLLKFVFFLIQGKKVGISLLLDKDVQVWKDISDKSDLILMLLQLLTLTN